MKASEDQKQLEIELAENLKKKQEIVDKLDQEKKHLESSRQSLSQTEILRIRLESIAEKQAKIKQLEKQKALLYGDIDLIKKHIEDVSKIMGEFEIYEKIYEKKNSEMREILQKENSFMVKKAEVKAGILFLERQIRDLEEEIKKIEEIAKKLGYMKELEFWLSNKLLQFILLTEKNVMLKLREDFSNLFSKWFSVLVSDSIVVKLDESFSPVIRQADYDVDYDYLSGGERTAIALAYRLALNQTINSLLSKIKTRDLVILDEPTDGFSESQLDKMRDILNQLDVKQLILVSHEQKIEGFVNNIIKFKKLEGVTQVEK